MNTPSSSLVEQLLKGTYLLGKVIRSIVLLIVNITSKTTACVSFVVVCCFGLGCFFAHTSSTSLWIKVSKCVNISILIWIRSILLKQISCTSSLWYLGLHVKQTESYKSCLFWECHNPWCSLGACLISFSHDSVVFSSWDQTKAILNCIGARAPNHLQHGHCILSTSHFTLQMHWHCW